MTQNRTTIRPAVRADADAIAEMANQLNRFHNNPDDLYSVRLIEADAFDRTPLFSILAAECDGTLAGYAFFQDSFNSEAAARGVWLLDLFVRENARRQSIGQDLLADAARETLARGVASLCWGVMSANLGARAFYAGLGARDENARILELDGAALTGLAKTAGE